MFSDMALVLQALTSVAATILMVDACVCYVGQESERSTGKRYDWSLAEQTPCACTEFRLAGVNMKPQKKLHEVKIGDDPRMSINEQGKIVISPDCNDDNHEPAIPCAYQPTYRFWRKELQDPLTSPIRLRFKVPEASNLIVFFSSDTPGYVNAKYAIYLTASQSGYRQRLPRPAVWVQSNTDINYFGEHLIITYDDGHFEIAIPGLPESTLTYDIPSAPPTSWFVSFQSGEKTVDWQFFEPCIYELNQ